jgi:undecaprenyl diphosphate synthase
LFPLNSPGDEENDQDFMAQTSASNLDHLSESELTAKLEPELLPKHVAVIMDGNGRWAELRGLPRIAGHREGINSLREMITQCLELGIQALTIYAFSQENWNRPAQEINALMGLLEHYLSTERASLIEQRVRFRTIGRLELLPDSAQHWVRTTEKETAHLDKLVLTVALSYGGRAEIVDAVKGLISDARVGTVQPEHLDEATIQRYLYTYPLPDPDLLIRTSGETRISNFLLWQLAYTELCFTPTLWPDFRRREFLLALLEYQRRERRFGRILSTVSS